MPGFFKSKNSSTQQEAASANWTGRIRKSLSRTRDALGKQLSGIFGSGKIDEALYEELENILLAADAGMDATSWLLDELRKQVRRNNLSDAAQLKEVLREALVGLLTPLAQPLDIEANKPCIIMLAGVNGAGKTTTIGKLAHHFQSQGKTVLLAAGDTFRAAAREQLAAWGDRNNVAVISHESNEQKADPAAVIFDAVNAAKARGIDIVLADTAGRLTTQLHLMEEIKKVKRVVGKAEQGAPHEVWLVLDANIGQNALNQVEAFDTALGLTGLIVTKLDGTAKGGVIVAIARLRKHKTALPIRFIGLGEGMEDLRKFHADEFVNALFD